MVVRVCWLGVGVLKGGRTRGVEAFDGVGAKRVLSPGDVRLRNYWRVRSYGEKVEAFEALAGDYGNHFHFAQEGYLWRC